MKNEERLSKEFVKISKTLTVPFKDLGVFEPSGGIQDCFRALQQRTTALSTNSLESSKELEATILIDLDRLDQDVKSKMRDIDKNAGKELKSVEKSRAETTKLIDTLAKNVSSVGSAQLKPSDDPYIVCRNVKNSLHKQVEDENLHRNSIIACQEAYDQLEQRIILAIQEVIKKFYSHIELQQQKTIRDMTVVKEGFEALSPTFEWEMLQRKDRSLIDPAAPPRNDKIIRFNYMDHATTKPLMMGELIRKGTVMKQKKANFFALTEAGYLHEMKNEDPLQDPDPVLSLYMPDCVVGSHSKDTNGSYKFKIKGKDSNKFITLAKTEYSFRASSYAEMIYWWQALRKAAGQSELASDDGDFSADEADVSSNVGSPNPNN